MHLTERILSLVEYRFHLSIHMRALLISTRRTRGSTKVFTEGLENRGVDCKNCENDGKKSVLETFNDVVTIKNLNEIIHSIDLFECGRATIYQELKC